MVYWFVSTVGFYSLFHTAFLVPGLCLFSFSPFPLSSICVCVLRPVFHQIQRVILFPFSQSIVSATSSRVCYGTMTRPRNHQVCAVGATSKPVFDVSHRTVVVLTISRNELRLTILPVLPNVKVKLPCVQRLPTLQPLAVICPFLGQRASSFEARS